MDKYNIKKDVVTYNAVLDAVCSQVRLGRMLFEEGVKKGFYAKVSRLATHWFELDLHFLSLGGGEIAMGWWFEECLVPYLNNTDKLNEIKSISIVTGFGKTRTRGRRQGDDGMRKRCKAMLAFMNIEENEQHNLGRLHIDMDSLRAEVHRRGGNIRFDLDGYIAWKERETTHGQVPDVEQKVGRIRLSSCITWYFSHSPFRFALGTDLKNLVPANRLSFVSKRNKCLPSIVEATSRLPISHLLKLLHHSRFPLWLGHRP
jgi:hypothetical protein